MPVALRRRRRRQRAALICLSSTEGRELLQCQRLQRRVDLLATVLAPRHRCRGVWLWHLQSHAKTHCAHSCCVIGVLDPSRGIDEK